MRISKIKEVYGAFAVVSKNLRIDYDFDGVTATTQCENKSEAMSAAAGLAMLCGSGTLRDARIDDHCSVKEHGGPSWRDGDSDVDFVLNNGEHRCISNAKLLLQFIKKLEL